MSTVSARTVYCSFEVPWACPAVSVRNERDEVKNHKLIVHVHPELLVLSPVHLDLEVEFLLSRIATELRAEPSSHLPDQLAAVGAVVVRGRDVGIGTAGLETAPVAFNGAYVREDWIKAERTDYFLRLIVQNLLQEHHFGRTCRLGRLLINVHGDASFSIALPHFVLVASASGEL